MNINSNQSGQASPGQPSVTSMDTAGVVHDTGALVNIAELRARITSVKESVRQDLKDMPPEVQESVMRHCEIESLPTFAMGDDEYAAAPGVVRGFLTQCTSVPEAPDLPSAEAKPETVDVYLGAFVSYLQEAILVAGQARNPAVTFDQLFVGGRKAFSLVANGGIYTHQIQVWFALEYVEIAVELLRGFEGGSMFNLHFADGPFAYDPKVLQAMHGFLTDEKQSRTVVPHAFLIRTLRKQTGKDMFIQFNKKRYPGKLFVSGDFSEDEIVVILKNGGASIGNKMAPLVAITPNIDTIKIFVEASVVNNVRAFNKVLATCLGARQWALGGSPWRCSNSRSGSPSRSTRPMQCGGERGETSLRRARRGQRRG
jgi:hypothetical protein